jgi:predicted DCC family thiol-disulfide oxidoreductase YuxK
MKRIIFYDEYCPLCNRIIKWIAHSDKNDEFRFAPLTLLPELFPNGPEETRSESRSTIWLKSSDGTWLKKSNAVLEVANHLTGLWQVLPFFSFLPLSFRDWVYGIVAKYRFKLFGGEKGVCPLPPPKIRSKFIYSADQVTT